MTVDLTDGDDASLSISVTGFTTKDAHIYFVVETSVRP
jgi:hypothetical protein